MKTLRSEGVGVNQSVRLVVCDQADSLALLKIMTAESRDGGRLACTKKTSDHDESEYVAIFVFLLAGCRLSYVMKC